MTSHISLPPPGFIERRRTPRYPVPPDEPVPVAVAVLDAEGKPRTFTGRARNLSRAGLAAFLPPDESCGELVGNARSLLVVVSLPAGLTQFDASPIHCRPLGGGRTGRGYVVGVKVTEIGEHDQSLLDEYLGGLGY